VRSIMETFEPSETLHRLIKHALDSGAAGTLTEAEELFHGYRIAFVIGKDQSRQPLEQATLLTAVALACRVFLGGVLVEGFLDVPLCAGGARGGTLADAIAKLGAEVSGSSLGRPAIIIGGPPVPRREGFCIRTICAGWRGGIAPGHSCVAPTAGPEMPLAAMLSAALAINEAFLYVSGGTPAAGHRVLGLSLWEPAANTDWLTDSAGEPQLTYLPSQLWLIGLGHLGQAYLWGLGLLPYADPASLSLILQDFDIVTPSTLSTSILSDQTMLSRKKTRVMAAWAEQRGFTTTICERLFDASVRRQVGEPTIGICGLDNALGRLALDKAGFDFVVEAGLGRGHRDFRTMRIHTLPNGRPTTNLWKVDRATEAVQERPAYQAMLKSGELDKCGVTLLAGRAIGASFVGAAAASLALSEVLRLLHGAPVNQLIDIDLQGIEHRSVVRNSCDFNSLNPGFATVCGDETIKSRWA
jgi:hypothetical protein